MADDAIKAQLEMLRRKLDVPAAKWDTLWQEQHDKAFTAAGALQADLLADLHGAVQRAADEGQSLDDFRASFDGIVERNGWLSDRSEKYRAWRARLIYETNLRTSYAAGRWAYLRENMDTMPYWRYNHDDTVMRPRMDHVALDGLVLSADDPFWRRGWPPSGWGCRCSVDGISAAYMRRHGMTVDPAPTDFQPDVGWDYAPGASVEDELRAFLSGKAESLPEPIKKSWLGWLAGKVSSSPLVSWIRRLIGG